MAVGTDMNHQEGLYLYLGGGDETKWTQIAKALNKGTTPAEIKTGRPFVGLNYDPSLIVFDGIEGEARVFPASWALSPQNPSAGFSNGFSYLILPDGVTTDLYFTIEIEEWWLKSSIGIFMEWANIHTATGNVRWQYEFKECDIALETFAQADVVQSFTTTEASPVANGGTTTAILFSQASGRPITFNPGGIAAFYSLRISRLGGDAADTLAGPVAFIATNMTRGL